MSPTVLDFPTPQPTPWPGPGPAPRPEPVPESGATLPLPSVFVPPAWAYRHLTRPLSELASFGSAELDRLGREGWELTGIVNDGSVAHFWFKRLLR